MIDSECPVPDATRRAYDHATIEAVLVATGGQPASRSAPAHIAAIVSPAAAAVLREEAAVISALPTDNADVMATRRRAIDQLRARADRLDPP